MSNIPIYNKDGKVYIDQSITAGESSNKVANAKFVVDTVNAKVDNFRQVTDNSFSQVVTPINNSLNTLKSVVDASFVKLGDGSITVKKATNLNPDGSVNGHYPNGQGGDNLFTYYNYLPYQSNTDTHYLRFGDDGHILQSTGSYTSTHPKWVSPSNLTVGTASNASLATNLARTSGIVYQSQNSVTATLDYNGAGKLLMSNSQGNEYPRNVPSWVSPSDLTVGNITGGSAGDLLYQSNSNTTAKLSIGTSGQILKVNGSVLSWSNDISSNGNVYAGNRLGFTSNETVTLDSETNSTVSLNRPCGKIILNTFTIGSLELINFVLNNTLIASGDVLILNQISGSESLGSYLLNATCETNKATIYVRNLSGGQIVENNLSIQYVLIKASS